MSEKKKTKTVFLILTGSQVVLDTTQGKMPENKQGYGRLYLNVISFIEWKRHKNLPLMKIFDFSEMYGGGEVVYKRHFSVGAIGCCQAEVFQYQGVPQGVPLGFGSNWLPPYVRYFHYQDLGMKELALFFEMVTLSQHLANLLEKNDMEAVKKLMDLNKE